MEPPSISFRKLNHFFGIARIDLDRLTFGDAVSNERRIGSKKIQAKLLDVFELEGCQRMEPENFIDALISRESLIEALSYHGTTIESFKDTCSTPYGSLDSLLRLRPNQALQCLNGLQRVAVARRFLDKNDRWWTVRLYEKERFEPELTNHIQEAFGHEQHYTDGTIFRNIRRYHLIADKANENKWWARLTTSKRRDLKQLFKDQRLLQAFDNLLEFPGIWPPVQLGTLHRQHGLRCSEEMISYLDHIRIIWCSMIPEPFRAYVDESSVQELELLAPGVSVSDNEQVISLFTRGKIFPALADAEDRRKMLQLVSSQRCLIPTLRTFFENQKYLEPCSAILRTLLDDTDKRSLWQSFRANFYSTHATRIQLSENIDDLGILSDSEASPTNFTFQLGYIQLWMFCFRHFPEMTRTQPKLESRQGPRVTYQHVNAALLPQLGRFAVNLGFCTDKAVELANESSEERAAEEFLKSVRPSWEGDISEQIADIKRVLKTIDKPAQCKRRVFDFNSNRTPTKERRCGRPYEYDHVQDRSSLFAPIFYYGVEPMTEFSSLYVKVDTFKAFFKHCLPAANKVGNQITNVWAKGSERNTSTEEQEVPSLIGQLKTELHQCQEQKEIADARYTTISDELGQAKIRIQTLEAGLASIDQPCMRCSDCACLKVENDALLAERAESEKKFRDLEARFRDLSANLETLTAEKENLMTQNAMLMEENLSLESIDSAIYDQHDNAAIGAEDWELLYHRLKETNASQQGKAAEEVETLKARCSSLQDQKDKLQMRYNDLEQVNSNILREAKGQESSMPERHRVLSYPLHVCSDLEVEKQFQSDTRYIIGQYINDGIMNDFITVRDLSFDETGLGFRSRLFRIAREERLIENFLRWLTPQKNRIFKLCTETPSGSLLFRVLTDHNAYTLMSASGEKTQIFYGLEHELAEEVFVRRYRAVSNFGPHLGDKRADAALSNRSRSPSPKRRGRVEGLAIWEDTSRDADLSAEEQL